MLRRLRSLRATIADAREQCASCAKGDLAMWYNTTKQFPILRSRITHLGDYGFYVDQYPLSVPIMTIPWTALRWTDRGWVILCDVDDLHVQVSAVRTPTSRTPKVLIRTIKKARK